MCPTLATACSAAKVSLLHRLRGDKPVPGCSDVDAIILLKTDVNQGGSPE